MDINKDTQNQSDFSQPKSPEQQQQEKFSGLHHDYLHKRRHSRWFGNLFWGLFVILIGVMFLARSLGYVSQIDLGGFLSHIWPLLIIFAGLSIMSRGGVAAEVVSILIALLILAVFALWIFRIPVHWQMSGRSYDFQPQMMDEWMNRGMMNNNQ